MAEIDDTDDNIIINDQDGLPNVHPNMMSSKEMNSPPEQTSEDDVDDPPSSLIVTNIHDSVFVRPERKQEMENLFRSFDPDVTFQWLHSFRRVRVNFKTPVAAATARMQLHQYRISESIITCYFAQPVTPAKNRSLQLPAPYKQFLISPPSSPPIGWQSREEGEPIINQDLIAAIANLAPGSSHELHPSSPGQPSIVVHTALSSASLVTEKS